MLPLVLYRVWAFLRRTIFNLVWWKKNWYLPWLFLLGIVVWLVTGGRGSAAGLVKKTNQIRKEERETIDRLNAESRRVETALEEAANAKRERVKKAAQEKLEREKNKLKKERELLRGDSEAINKNLNDALND